MRCLIYSDLHLEFEHVCNVPLLSSIPSLPDLDLFDVIILAGDIGKIYSDNDHLYHFLSYLNQLDKPVVFVLGNHEYYDCKDGWDEAPAYLKEQVKALKNVNVLHKDTFKYNNYTFIGATLWTRCGEQEQNNGEYSRCSSGSNDFCKITKANGEPITADDVFARHIDEKKYLKQQLELANLENRKTIVVSHMSPLAVDTLVENGVWQDRNIDKRLTNKELKSPFKFYTTDLSEELIRNYTPSLLVHGHIHYSLDVMECSTRIVCNPRGYIKGNRTNKSFSDTKIIEIGTKPKLQELYDEPTLFE
jgi:Icc-related predicted phosphoesterase